MKIMHNKHILKFIMEERYLIAIILLGTIIRTYVLLKSGTLAWDEAAHGLGGVLLKDAILHGFRMDYVRLMFDRYWAGIGSLFFYPWGYNLFTTPLYFLFGANEISARLPSFIFSILVIHGTYLLGKEAYDKKTGVIAAFLVAVNPFMTYWGVMALLDLPLTALMVYSSYFLLKAVKNKSILPWVGMGLSLGLAAQMKPVALIMLPAMAGYVVMKRRKVRMKHAALGFLLVLVLIGPYFLFGAVAKDYMSMSVGDEIHKDILHWFNPRADDIQRGGGAPTPLDFYFRFLFSQLGVLTLILCLVGLIAVFSKKVNMEAYYLIGVCFIIFLVFTILPGPVSRYTMPAIPVLCLFGARGIQVITNAIRIKKVEIAAALILILVFFESINLLHDFSPNSAPYDSGVRETVGWITKNKPGLTVVLNETNDINVLTLSFYISNLDPELHYGVSWESYIGESRYIVSTTKKLNLTEVFEVNKGFGNVYVYAGPGYETGE